MRKILFLTAFFLIFAGYSFAFDDGDFQYWNNESFSWKLNKYWKATLEEEFRFGDGGSDFYYQYTDAGVYYSGLASWLDVGFNYRHILEESKSSWKHENRPHLNATIKFNLAGFDLINRGRVEYRNREDKSDLWQYRNKFTVQLPFKLTRLEIQPYIADEIFVDFDIEELNRNRLYSGVSLKIFKNLKAEIYYLWQSDKKKGKWSDLNILGTKLKFSF